MLNNFVFAVNDAPAAAPDGLTILCVVDGPGATWRLSFELPLRRLRNAGRVRLICIEEKSLDRPSSQQIEASAAALLSEVAPDVVILSRCNSMAATILIETANARKLPVIYHIDDDLFAVPKELGKSKFDYYNSPALRAGLRLCCERANLIYCSTQSLAYRIGRFGFDTPITCGAIYCSAPEPFVAYRPKQPRTIGYMGTGGHKADLDFIVPAIIAVMANYPDVGFEIFGTLDAPEQLKQAYPNRVTKLPPVADYDSFLERMRQLNWAVALAPLKDSAFNAVKANTKFIEYTIGGLPCVVSAGQVYAAIIAGKAGIAATSVIEWITAIDRLLCDPDEAQAQVEQAQARLRRDYTVAKLEQQVMAVLGRVVEDKKTMGLGQKPDRRNKRLAS